MLVIPATSHKVMPWKNGRGLTTQILIDPEGADINTFDLRISAATVTSDDPFSRLPGIDRTLFVLEGEGLRLKVGESAAVDVTASSPPFRFAGDVDTQCQLIGGRVIDLNVMTRRQRYSHTASRIEVGSEMQLRVSGAPAVLLCYAGAASLRISNQVTMLSAMDGFTAMADDQMWTLASPTRASMFLIQVRPA